MFFKSIKVLTADWSSDGLVRSYSGKIAKNEATEADLKAFREHLKSKLKLDASIQLVDVLDKNMKVAFSVEDGRIGHDEIEHLEGRRMEDVQSMRFGEVIVGKTMVIEDEQYHPDNPVFHSLAPIMDSEGEFIGFILIHFSSEYLNKILLGEMQLEEGAITGQKFVLEQKTAEMYLVNRNRLMITPSRFTEHAILNQKVDTEPVKKCFENKEEFTGDYVNYLDKKVFGASMCFLGYDMILLVEIGEDELFTHLKKERNDIIIAGIFAFLASIILAFLLARIFLKDLMGIVAVAKEIVKGNFSVRAKIRSKDELRDLAESFNEMLDSIEESRKKLKEAEIELKETNKSLEKRVQSRTAELERLKGDLEKNVDQKTAELQKKLIELEKFKELTIGRELRMITLKKQVEDLKNNGKK